MGKKGSLARRVLALQLLIVLGLLLAVAAVSVVQAREQFRDTEGRKLLGLAESVAVSKVVREELVKPVPTDALDVLAESRRAWSGVSFVSIADANGIVRASQDPDQLSSPLRRGASTVFDGRAWVGVIDGELVAHVPVFVEEPPPFGRIGYVAAGQEQPNVWQIVTDSPADLILLLGIATGLGVAGSLWLAWWVKRQTLGLEPSEIAGLAEYREAMLHGIKEGVVGLDQQHRVTLLNDQARALLSLPGDAVGRRVGELDLNERLIDVLTGKATGSDQIGLRRGKVLIMNRMPIELNGRGLGAVVTLRDRTELVQLQDQLDANRNTTETLRAQAHEFSNQLHTIAGLIELGEYDDVLHYVTRLSTARGQWQAEVTGKVHDSAVAALLIAKASLAAEHDVRLRLSDASALGEVDETLSADLVTVLGNLVDNALDVLHGHSGGSIEVDLTHSDDEVRVVVRDSGPGVAPEIAEEVFQHGFTTKAAEEGGRRGLGLALIRQTCVRRGGTVAVHNADGAVFTATLPVSGRVPA